VTANDGTRVPVNYTMRATPEGWKAWDVTIEGISYVKNFRTDIGAEIDQRGLEAVIDRLESEAEG
jgi:phospholipid transport system substrate-binding protein